MPFTLSTSIDDCLVTHFVIYFVVRFVACFVTRFAAHDDDESRLLSSAAIQLY